MLLEKLLKAVADYFCEDPTAPGIQVSWIEDQQMWYVAIHRYNGVFARDRIVFLNSVKPTLDEAIRDLGRRFLVKIGKIPKEALDNLMKEYHGKEVVREETVPGCRPPEAGE